MSEYFAFNTKLEEVKSGDNAVIGNILSISHGGISRDSLDVTDLDATNKAMKFIPGMIDAGDLSLEINYTKATSDVLHGYIGDGKKDWMITFPLQTGKSVAAKFEFEGCVTGVERAVERDGKITGSASFKLTGIPSFSKATA